MKTPMQELIDEINQKIDYVIQKESGDEMWHKFYCDFTINALAEIESILKQSYLEKEKDAIIDAYFEGARGWFEECRGDVADYDKEEAEKYYKDTFTK